MKIFEKKCRFSFRPSPLSLAVLLLLCQLCHPVFAADKSAPLPDEKILKSDSPLNIASDRMDVKQRERIILFEGHVVVQQDDLTITGNVMRVYSASSGKVKDGESAMMDKIERIEVEGDVKISQRDKIATAQKAVYYHGEQKIVLMGRPSVSQGPDSVQGRLITLYLAQGRSVVEGGGDSPVKAVLHPNRKE